MRRSDGSLSVRGDAVGGPVLGAVSEKPAGWASGGTTLTLLIHGYNNNFDEARDAFACFRSALPDRLPGVMGEFYWPGDADFGFLQILDFLSYPSEITDAKEAALRLSVFILDAIDTQPSLEIVLVGHSMGCRLIMELLKILAAYPNRPVVKLVILMAAAIPVELAEEGKIYDRAGELAEERVILYSGDDNVLSLAFPAGQALAHVMGTDSDLYTEAVGRHGNPESFPSEPAIRRAGNSHGDYWDDLVAREILSVKMGVAVDRSVQVRKTAEIPGTPTLDEIAEREMQERDLGP